jgi:hypothetical protein
VGANGVKIVEKGLVLSTFFSLICEDHFIRSVFARPT